MTAARKILGGTRGLIGIGGWIAPDLTARAFGIDPARSNRFVTRLFASRELTLSLALLTAGPAHLPEVAAVGAAIDTVDAVAGFDEHSRGNLSTTSLVSGVLGAVAFAVMGARVAQESRRE